MIETSERAILLRSGYGANRLSKLRIRLPNLTNRRRDEVERFAMQILMNRQKNKIVVEEHCRREPL